MRTYSRQDHDFVVDSRALTGVPDDGEVAVALEGETWEHSQDANENVTRSKKPNAIGTITIPITYGHPDNEYMQDLYDTDARTRKDPIDVAIRDLFGAARCTGVSMSIIKVPDMALAATVGSVSWELRGKLVFKYGTSETTE